MECKLSAENDRLEKELEQIKKDIDYWRKEYHHVQEMNSEWCKRIEKIVDELKIVDADCLETRLLKLFDDYALMRNELGKPIEKSVYICNNVHCRRYMSSMWDFCPYCGSSLKGKEITELKEMFKKIEEKLPMDNSIKDKEFQWRCRWSWLQRRIFEGKDYNE